MSPTTARRHFSQIARRIEMDGQTTKRIEAADHYTEQDRRTAESLEASELLREFIAMELA